MTATVRDQYAPEVILLFIIIESVPSKGKAVEELLKSSVPLQPAHLSHVKDGEETDASLPEAVNSRSTFISLRKAIELEFDQYVLGQCECLCLLSWSVDGS